MTDFKGFISGLFKVLIAALVIAFIGIHSYNFFDFTFSDELQYFAWLGFGLTSVSVIGYMIIFKWGDGSEVQRGIAFIMMIVALIGEMFTAGFGMQLESMNNAGIVLSKQEYQVMVYFVQGLGFLHGIALILYFSFDDITALFSGQRVPTKNKAANKKQPANKPARVLASDTQKQSLKK